MPYAALAEKLRLIPEQYFDEVSDFLDFLLFRTKGEHNVPSAELTLAIAESETMLAAPDTKKFDSVHALFADLDAED